MSKHLVAEQDIRVTYVPLGKDIQFHQNVRVVMRDGVALSVNVFRPKAEGKYPVIMAVSPYGKDQFLQNEAFRVVPTMHLGEIKISDHTAFEAPDPNFWVGNGYVVIQGDVRGQGQSDGATGPYHIQDREDYYDLIQWAAAQEWSSGKVGLSGVSYLCTSQWGVAALKPPHLAAVVMWEGWNDWYRRHYKGGIPETSFMPWIWNSWLVPNHNPQSAFAEPDYLANTADHELLDTYWEQFDPRVEEIEIPALVCGSFSDQGLHTPDTVDGFVKLASKDKWLFSHRRPKWSAYYDEKGVALQKQFLDYYLKGEGNGLLDRSTATIEVNTTRDDYVTLALNDWPNPSAKRLTLFLDGAAAKLEMSPVIRESGLQFDSTTETGLAFDFPVKREITLIGDANLSLWVSTTESDDIDLFVGIEKLDVTGERVLFHGFGGINPNDIVARGWLRVSHREKNEVESTPFKPVHKHERRLMLRTGDPVHVEIRLLPNATTFLPGETLRVVIQGRQIQPDSPILGFEKSVNRGIVTVHTGGTFKSNIVLPEYVNG